MFNHMFDIGFTVISDKADGNDIPVSELIEALKARVASLEAMNPLEVEESFGLCDTYEIDYNH